MRRVLDFIYQASGALAAFFLVAICAIVLLQVGANLVDFIVKAVTGEPIGLVIPSYAEFAGFFLAASSFLALAYTLRHGGHIRVNLIIQHIGGRRRRGIELWCVAAAALMSGYFAFYAVNLTLESLEFGDLSFGMVPVPLWIPQSSLALGAIIVTIALVDEFVCVLRGAEPSYEAAAQALLTGGESETHVPPGR
ncbi:MAG: TRAP transporter small permease [Alphaproteobacteria bacterium]|nr:TRAP transporter small permease [Alphaproteobacteria bacterium]